ncbi:ER lumen protein retaining receptor-domain-containing protein [Lipomyces kononenkoae]|uniref:ER lumen protein retaining receptor-domain-containing protein n=1 Tax=Lipomyces kononenkoae TaxID=34357 RepID=A0ACC3T5X8_LIPKO
MRSSRSCAGLSFKSQALYAVVFITRYIDLLWGRYTSLYNTVMKLFFIGSSLSILYLMKVKFRPTHDPNIDTFKIEYLLSGSFIMAILFTHKYTIPEILWSFSIWLESVAILPQLFMLQRTGEAESLTTHYLFALGAYRALYIPNWIYRWLAEGHVEPIAILAGIIQTVLYSDFFYIYYTKVMRGKKFELPQ